MESFRYSGCILRKEYIPSFTSLIVDGQLPAWNPFVELNKVNEEDALKELVLDIEAALERYPESYKVQSCKYLSKL